MTNRKWSEWKPLPSGAVIACMLGPYALVLVFVSVLQSDPYLGVFALGGGLFCIYLVGEASYTAGMRREADSARRARDGGVYDLDQARPPYSGDED